MYIEESKKNKKQKETVKVTVIEIVKRNFKLLPSLRKNVTKFFFYIP